MTGPDLPHQPGVVTHPPPATVMAAFDLFDAGRDTLTGLLRGLNGRICDLQGTAEVTLTVGASLFDARFGLRPALPRRLVEMPEFPNDVLQPAFCHGDVLLQVSAEQPETAQRALSALVRAPMRPRWRIDGFRGENTVNQVGQPITRNLFGFREGAGNPDPDDRALMDRLVWVQPGSGEPEWAVGGSYQVVRIIRFSRALWDTDSAERQEAIIGRRKLDGAPLGQNTEVDPPDYAADPDGRLVPLDAHIRRANPRTPQTDPNRILRRGYSFQLATTRPEIQTRARYSCATKTIWNADSLPCSGA